MTTILTIESNTTHARRNSARPARKPVVRSKRTVAARKLNSSARSRSDLKHMKKGKSTSLAKDQLWKVKDEYLQIVDLGKTLIHYKISAGLKQRGVPVRMTAIDTVEKYLKTHQAVLVRG